MPQEVVAPDSGAAASGSGVLVVPGSAGSAGFESVRVPTPRRSGRAKPWSSSALACSYIGTGRCSPRMSTTTSRRPLRSAAPMKVCRASSVKPVLPPM